MSTETKFPCSDYVETRGVIFFARMLDKIRLHARGELPDGYNLGFSDATSFDARFCRFWEIDYAEVEKLTLAGGTNEEVFDQVFAGRTLNSEQVLVWNAFIEKRGWNDSGSQGLQKCKVEAGFENRPDILTWADLHDAEEGRTPRSAGLLAG